MIYDIESMISLTLEYPVAGHVVNLESRVHFSAPTNTECLENCLGRLVRVRTHIRRGTLQEYTRLSPSNSRWPEPYCHALSFTADRSVC